MYLCIRDCLKKANSTSLAIGSQMKGHFLQCQIQWSLSCHLRGKKCNHGIQFKFRIKITVMIFLLQKDQSVEFHGAQTIFKRFPPFSFIALKCTLFLQTFRSHSRGMIPFSFLIPKITKRCNTYSGAKAPGGINHIVNAFS